MGTLMNKYCEVSRKELDSLPAFHPTSSQTYSDCQIEYLKSQGRDVFLSGVESKIEPGYFYTSIVDRIPCKN